MQFDSCPVSRHIKQFTTGLLMGNSLLAVYTTGSSNTHKHSHVHVVDAELAVEMFSYIAAEPHSLGG